MKNNIKMREFVISTVFFITQPGAGFWSTSKSSMGHKMSIISAPDADTAKSLVVMQDKQHWTEKYQDMCGIDLIGALELEITTIKKE